MKSMNDIESTFSGSLKMGDVVDESIQDHFIECLPPITWNSSVIQMGEPYSHDPDGRATYLTLIKSGQDWLYMGDQIKGGN